jgi:hypothetical protein
MVDISVLAKNNIGLRGYKILLCPIPQKGPINYMGPQIDTVKKTKYKYIKIDNTVEKRYKIQ